MDTQTTLPARQPADGRLSSSDLFAFAGARQIIGDSHGMLMQDEVADRIQKLVNVLRETVGLMDAFRMMDGLPGMSPEESLMARVAYRNINEMLDRVMPEWDAVCKAIHEAERQRSPMSTRQETPESPQRADVGELAAPPCSLCGGKGHYMYDHNHGKPCEQCCEHADGWWKLAEHHAGYIAGADNGCCRSGCGQLRRELLR